MAIQLKIFSHTHTYAAPRVESFSFPLIIIICIAWQIGFSTTDSSKSCSHIEIFEKKKEKICKRSFDAEVFLKNPFETFILR